MRARVPRWAEVSSRVVLAQRTTCRCQGWRPLRRARRCPARRPCGGAGHRLVVRHFATWEGDHAQLGRGALSRTTGWIKSAPWSADTWVSSLVRSSPRSVEELAQGGPVAVAALRDPHDPADVVIGDDDQVPALSVAPRTSRRSRSAAGPPAGPSLRMRPRRPARSCAPTPPM
jgi:hypothetical protein